MTISKLPLPIHWESRFACRADNSVANPSIKWFFALLDQIYILLSKTKEF